MTHLTPADLDRLDALLHAATTQGGQFCPGCGKIDTRCECMDLIAAAYPKLAAEIRRLRAEVAEIDDVIGGRGVPERDCTLPLPERVDNIIVELKNWRHDYGTEAMENEKLRAENERLRAVADMLARYITTHPDAKRLPDWACRRCRPDSDVLRDGFVCAFHQAQDWMDAARGGA